MKKINLAISGCMGRMGQQLIRSANRNKSFKIVSLTENKNINKKISGIKPITNSEKAYKKAKMIIFFLCTDIFNNSGFAYFKCYLFILNFFD